MLFSTSCSGDENNSTSSQTTTPLISTPVTLDFNSYTYIATINSAPTQVKIYEQPSESSEVINQLEHPRKIAGATETIDLVFTLIDNDTLPQGWLNVNLPIRPNGSTGWIKSDIVELSSTLYRIEIDKDNFNLKVLYDNDIILDTPVAIGNGDTPTPDGQFYITELLDSELNEAYGPFAYGLSGYSESLKEFKGVDAIIGIHGTNDPASIGTNVSHGCIRVDNEIITAMTEYLPIGTPVEIL